jgi:hypothetical protein
MKLLQSDTLTAAPEHLEVDLTTWFANTQHGIKGNNNP